MTKIFILFLFVFSLVGCSHSHTVGTSKCRDLRLISYDPEKNYEEVTGSYWTIFQFRSSHYLEIEDTLKRNKLECTGVRAISYRLEKRWSDALLSTLPFVSRTHLSIQIYD